MTIELPDNVNSALFIWNGPLGLPEYNKFTDDDFEAAFDFALPAHLVKSMPLPVTRMRRLLKM